jgi:hypothetical protein
MFKTIALCNFEKSPGEHHNCFWGGGGGLFFILAKLKPQKKKDINDVSRVFLYF